MSVSVCVFLIFSHLPELVLFSSLHIFCFSWADENSSSQGVKEDGETPSNTQPCLHRGRFQVQPFSAHKFAHN